MKKPRVNKELTLRVRVSQHEMDKLRRFAARHKTSVSQVVREYVRRLPNNSHANGELAESK